MKVEKKQINKRWIILGGIIIAGPSKRWLNAIIFLISSSCCLCCQNNSKSCSQGLNEVNRLLTVEKDSLKLVQEISQIISENEQCLDLYLIRGDINLSMGNLSRAYNDFSCVIRRDRQNIYALYMLGIIYNQQQKFDSAVVTLQNAINYKTRGTVVVDYNNKALMKEKAKYDVEYNELIYTQGLSFYYKRDLKHAFDIFSFCISNKYRLSDSYLFRGVITIETKKGLNEGCNDIQLAELYGNKSASIYKEKFCK